MAIKFNLPESAYQPGGLTIVKSATEKEARKEYQRLRKAALKRIARLAQSEYKSDYIVKHGKTRFSPSSQIVSLSALSRSLSDIRRFLESPQSSITGRREPEARTIKTLRSHGYKFVTKDNIKQFGEFMDAARMKAGGKLLSSDRVADLYDQSERKAIPADELLRDFEYWAKNLSELKKSHRTKPGGDSSAEAYKERIEKRKAKRARKK